jgi:hypothetical protein
MIDPQSCLELGDWVETKYDHETGEICCNCEYFNKHKVAMRTNNGNAEFTEFYITLRCSAGTYGQALMVSDLWLQLELLTISGISCLQYASESYHCCIPVEVWVKRLNE